MIARRKQKAWEDMCLYSHAFQNCKNMVRKLLCCFAQGNIAELELRKWEFIDRSGILWGVGIHKMITHTKPILKPVQEADIDGFPV